MADRVLIEKSSRRMTLYSHGAPIRTYKVSLGKHPIGPKQRQGDNRTPEGLYIIDHRLAASTYHRALHVSYPGPQDQARAAAQGVEPGGDIMIHGIRNGLGWLGPLHRLRDWTAGCIAVTDREIEEIWTLVPDGTTVEIKP
jgi:murein L,D-transpeptidase YafK